jgi:hypothetical protein
MAALWAVVMVLSPHMIEVIVLQNPVGHTPILAFKSK